ncbi:MAG TPA: alpha-ketoglutarate-dependent dioxygenase AlkB [Gemmatimonadaceae bacterium]|nr:alpha-ketoglutarate-dependent dioxygenase AlkB [Gemmatimonadaceae bacterium]
MRNQLSLLESATRLPEGFGYQPSLVSPAEEEGLVRELKGLPFKNFEFHGHLGKRRVVFYGWRYDFNQGGLRQADPIPAFLLALRDKAATFARMPSDRLQHVLVTEYDVGAAIGWHRDKAVFGDVIGISLLAPCVFRLRRKAGMKWERASLTLEPRSVYLLRGPSRTEWEHSIPAVDALRYSITFRSMRADD